MEAITPIKLVSLHRYSSHALSLVTPAGAATPGTTEGAPDTDNRVDGVALQSVQIRSQGNICPIEWNLLNPVWSSYYMSPRAKHSSTTQTQD